MTGITDPTTLLTRFGLSEFRPGQRDVIDAVAAGQDVMCVMPTGGGKSLCYQLPSLARRDHDCCFAFDCPDEGSG